MGNEFFSEKEEDISKEEILDEDYDAENFEGEEFDDDDCKDDNYKLIYDKTYLEQLKYLYPDDELLKKAKKVYSSTTKSMKIILIVIFLTVFLLSLLFSLLDIDIALNDYLVPIALGFVIIISFYLAFVNKKLLKEQYALLKEDVGKYHLQITLHDIRKTHTKKCNKLFFFVILFYAVEIGIINLLDFTVDISEDLIDYLFLGGFGLFILAIVFALVLAYKSYKKIRQAMIPIENKLDMQSIKKEADIE